MRSIVLVSAMAAALLGADAARERKLQQAIDLMETKGDLAGAMALFGEAARSSDRGLAARALLHLAQAQERRGKEQARATYGRIASEFGDQREIAAQARQRLVALGDPTAPKSPTLTARRIWTGSDVDSEGMPTPDGRFTTLVHWDTGDIAVRDLSTGSIKRLMLKKSWQDSVEYGEWPVLSPDQRQLAFAWFSARENRYQLRMGANEAGAKPRILVDNAEFSYFMPTAWSPDGKSVLVTVWKRDNTTQIAWISAADGSMKSLRSLEWRNPNLLSLSPDGRYIAYDVLEKPDRPERDIHVIAADGSSDSIVVEHPALDSMPVWTPDGSSLVFTSSRSGSMGLWLIPMQNGKAAGAAQLIKADVGPMFPKVFTRSGTLYYFDEQSGRDIFAAGIAPDGRIGTTAVRLADSYFGRNSSATWSPDGKWIAWHSWRGQARYGPGSVSIVIKSLETGEERSFTPAINIGPNTRPLWLNSGKLLEAAGDAQARTTIYSVDTATGKLEVLVGPLPREYRRYGVALSPDNTTVYITKRDENGKRDALIAIDLRTRKMREIYGTPDQGSIGQIAVNPAGGDLAFILNTREGGRPEQRVCRMDPDGRSARDIHRPDPNQPVRFAFVTWSKDGGSLLLIQTSDTGVAKLWRIPSNGGTPEPTGLSGKLMRLPAVSPDGTRLAFTAGEFVKAELWALENVLPALKASR